MVTDHWKPPLEQGPPLWQSVVAQNDCYALPHLNYFDLSYKPSNHLRNRVKHLKHTELEGYYDDDEDDDDDDNDDDDDDDNLAGFRITSFLSSGEAFNILIDTPS